MRMANISEAKAQLSKLVEQAERGEDIVISRAGRPVARLVAYKPQGREWRPGALKGQIVIGEDFDAFDEEIARMFGMVD